ncbi:MAG: VCBS domain-containing protein, partial [Nitratireductor sp.]|nr:VCBS domain-containing protein [Nitratireductor sp.]
MATTSPQSGANAVTSVLPASIDGHPVTIDDTELLFRGDYAREGFDLVISLDGRSVVIAGYFLQDHQSDVAAPSGAFLSGDVVSALAGPLAPGEYAQTGALASGLKEIGKVIKLEGTATVTHPDGTVAELQSGDTVYQGDVVQTGQSSKLGISFLDDSVFSLSDNARMVLDKLVYDPDDAANSSMAFNLVQGAFVFVTGQVAPAGDMQIKTPVATMGIRGTTPKVLINTALGVVEFTVLPDPGSGHVGSYVLTDPRTGTIIGRVDSSGDKWVVTTLSGEAVRIGKSGLDLLEDQIALDELRDVVTKAFGDHTQVDTSHIFDQVAFNSSSANNNNNGGNDDGSGNGGQGGNTNGGEDAGKDDPPIAGDDAFTINEDQFGIANVIDGSVGGKDIDPDGFAVTVSKVNGATLSFDPNNGGYATVPLPSGAILLIKANGTFSYNPNDKFDYLGFSPVEQATDTFTYTIRDPNGFEDTATVTVTLDGRNDQPIITAGDTAGDIEIAGQTGGTDDLTASGTLNFTDVDLTDTHTVTGKSLASAVWSTNGTVPSATLSELAAATTFTASVGTDSTGTGSGTIDWSFTLEDQFADFLAVGEYLEITYRVVITDDSGIIVVADDNELAASDYKEVKITITSTNDQPVITAGDSDDLTEAANQTGTAAPALETSGTLSFTDADLTDTHTVTTQSLNSAVWSDGTVPTATQNAVASATAFTASVTTDSTGTGTGTISWNFSIDDDYADFLAQGETLTLTYDVVVTDSTSAGNKASATEQVEITITGTDDA